MLASARHHPRDVETATEQQKSCRYRRITPRLGKNVTEPGTSPAIISSHQERGPAPLDTTEPTECCVVDAV